MRGETLHGQTCKLQWVNLSESGASTVIEIPFTPEHASNARLSSKRLTLKMRVLIVDDEPWARKRIAALLKSEAGIDVIRECSTSCSS
jgi:PleD family two-component response regulator